LALALLPHYGLLGVACAVAFSSLLTRGLLQWLWGCWIMRVTLQAYAKYVFVPTTAIALVPIALFAVVGSNLRSVSWPTLLVAGMSYALVYTFFLAPFLFGREGLLRLMQNAVAGFSRSA
jgi:hypothetical protein